MIKSLLRRLRMFFVKMHLDDSQLSFEHSLEKKMKEDYDYLISKGVETELGNVTLRGLPIIVKAPGSRIYIGKGVTLISEQGWNMAGINHPVLIATYASDSEIVISDGVGISGGSINCVTRCEIGKNTLIGANTDIWDTDFHPLNIEDRRHQVSINEAKTGPIIIEEDVWIGAKCTVLKNVRIGKGSVIAVGSVVNKDIPSNCIAAGLPAAIVAKINERA